MRSNSPAPRTSGEERGWTPDVILYSHHFLQPPRAGEVSTVAHEEDVKEFLIGLQRHTGLTVKFAARKTTGLRLQHDPGRSHQRTIGCGFPRTGRELELRDEAQSRNLR